MKLNFGTVLFDFDGTLFDSSEGIFKVLNMLFGRIINRSDGRGTSPFIGPPIYDSFKSFIPTTMKK